MSNPNNSKEVVCEFCGLKLIPFFVCTTKEQASKKCFIDEEE